MNALYKEKYGLENGMVGGGLIIIVFVSSSNKTAGDTSDSRVTTLGTNSSEP